MEKIKLGNEEFENIRKKCVKTRKFLRNKTLQDLILAKYYSCDMGLPLINSEEYKGKRGKKTDYPVQLIQKLIRRNRREFNEAHTLYW